MQMAFYDGAMFPEWRGDALAAMRGSWNRRPPSGYEVVRVDFQDGRPIGIQPVLAGFLTQQGEDWRLLGRPTGIAVAPDGVIFVSGDTQGIIYRISSDAVPGQSVEDAGAVPDQATPPPPTPLAIDMIETEGSLTVRSAFDPGWGRGTLSVFAQELTLPKGLQPAITR